MNKKRYELMSWLEESKKEMGEMWIRNPEEYRKYLKGADETYKSWRKSVYNLAHHIWE